MAMKQKYGLSTPGREGQQGKWTVGTIWYFFVRKESMLYEWKIEHLWYFVQWRAASEVRRLKKIHAEPKKKKTIFLRNSEGKVFFISEFRKWLVLFQHLPHDLREPPHVWVRVVERGGGDADGGGAPEVALGVGNYFFRDFVRLIFFKKRREFLDSWKFVRLK